jgi:hypothetical protein
MSSKLIPNKDILDAAFLTPNSKVLSPDNQSLLSVLGNRGGIPEPKRAVKLDGTNDYLFVRDSSTASIGNRKSSFISNGNSKNQFSY